jgi:hypothetical protein
MARTQKNKATSAHLGLLKAKLARYRQQLLDEVSKGKGGGAGDGMLSCIVLLLVWFSRIASLRLRCVSLG